jgi:hypothetical protein
MNQPCPTPILRSMNLIFMLILSQLSIAQNDEAITLGFSSESTEVLAESVSEMIALVAPGMENNSELNALMLDRIQKLKQQTKDANLEASEVQLWRKKFDLTEEQVHSLDRISQRFSNLSRGNKR